jgi:hypothetical protein
MPFRVQENIGGWRFAYLPMLLCAFALAADPPLVPLTVCEVLHDLPSYEGKGVAVVGRYSFREGGRWMGEQACDAGSPGPGGTPPLLWLVEDSGDGPKPPGDFELDAVALNRKLALMRQHTSLGKFRFGTPDYDRWAVVYGRVETRKAEAAKQAPANLVFRGSGVVVFLALDQ